MNTLIIPGKVVLAGAGPGDPELLTIRAWRALDQADVVLTDRLVSPEILHQCVRPETEIVHVGKQSGRGTSSTQEDICEQMIHFARQGKNVVRLKGGDATVFSNILDELRALKSAGIEYQIIPGITAASGASAYASIPLTARGVSAGVRYLCGNSIEEWNAGQWAELAHTRDTQVYYMGVQKIDTIVRKLLLAGAERNQEIALIEEATTPGMQVHTTTLGSFHSLYENHEFRSPSLVIIGNVVALHAEFNWLQTQTTSSSYFPPLAHLIATDFLHLKKTVHHASRA